MKATSRFLPRARSPWSVEGPSARTSPGLIFWPSSTVDFGGGDEVDLAGAAVGGAAGADLQAGTLRPAAHEHAILLEAAPPVDGRVGLGDDVLLFLISGEVDDLVGDAATSHLAVRRLDE